MQDDNKRFNVQGYDPNSINPHYNSGFDNGSQPPQNNQKVSSGNAKTKHGIWGYVLTAGISVFLTASIFIAIFAVLYSNRIIFGQDSSGYHSSVQEEKGYGLDFKDTEENQEALQKLNTVLKLLGDNYYKELSDKELIEAMTSGLMLEMESPYTFYMDPEYVQDMEESMSGVYSGIGATVEKVGADYQISDLVPESPAEKSGLQINDIFVSIDGKNAAEYQDVTALAMDIRGEEGTTVKVVIYRRSDNKEYTFDVKRAKITNANIHYRMLTDKIGYVRITEFNDNVSDNFIYAMDFLQEEGAEDVVFDLRNNGGGYVHEVLAMLDYLLPEGELITEVGRRNGEPFEIQETSDARTGVPDTMNYICLMNGNSASASELFAGCLRDWQKAQLVGETSYGKGVGTITKYLTDGSAVQITNFYYNLPNGENVDQVGLEPDYPVELPEEVQNVIVSRIEPEQDTQLQKAIEVLENKE